MDLIERASRLVGYASAARYRGRGDFVFDGIPLEGTQVLEVGCGTGAWTIWSALHGADRVVGIEPEAAGSSSNSLATLRRSIQILGLESRVELRADFLRELPRPERPYDVVVMYNVINHLDEEAVVSLLRAPAAAERYLKIMRDLRSRVRPGAWVVVADCTRHNFWDHLGLRSPFAPTIEWHKHQSPSLWVKLFEQAGFRKLDVRWSPLQPFRHLTANRLAQYLTSSHFVLRLRAA